MFILGFIVFYNVKKGSVVSYSSCWDFDLINQSKSLFYSWSKSSNYSLVNSLYYRFVFTSITSRLTSYFLLTFWLFFFFYGESMLLIILNYSTTVDTITSNSFISLKQHIIFYIETTPSKLSGCAGRTQRQQNKIKKWK
jgi:hypothetical protein